MSGAAQLAAETLEKELASVKHDAEETARLNATLRLLYVVGNRHKQLLRDPDRGAERGQAQFWKQRYLGLLVSFDPTGMHAAASRRAALAVMRYYDTAQSHWPT